MRILTFDTSLDTMYVTIGENERVDLCEIVKTTKERYNSALLIPAIIGFLKKMNLVMQDIEAIGVSIGPGSFTGIRASATVARTIAQNLNIPAIGISSLQILSLINNTRKNALCLMDARRNKAYAGIYNHYGDIIQNPEAIDYEKAVRLAKNDDFYIIADSKMVEVLKNEEIKCTDFTQTDCNLGINLAKLSYKSLQKGNPENFKWFNLKPLYIQPPPISMPIKQS